MKPIALNDGCSRQKVTDGIVIVCVYILSSSYKIRKMQSQYVVETTKHALKVVKGDALRNHQIHYDP